jgi:hypothetical protein
MIKPRARDLRIPFDSIPGEMTGTTWVEEPGFLYVPFTITNTFSVGLMSNSLI